LLCPTGRWRWWLFFCAFMALAIAMSMIFPFKGWMYDYIPFENFYRHPAMSRAYFLFFIIILALMGAKAVSSSLPEEQGNLSRHILIITLGSSMAAVCLFLAGYYDAYNELPIFRRKFALFHFLIVWGGISLAAVSYYYLASRKGGRLLFILLFISISIADAAGNLVVSSPIIFSEKTKYWDLGQTRNRSLELGSDGFHRNGASWDSFNLVLKLPAYLSYQGGLSNNHLISMFHVPPLLDMSTGKERIWFAPDPPKTPVSNTVFNAFVERVKTTGKPAFLLHEIDDIAGSKSPSPPGRYIDQLKNQAPPVQARFDIIEYTPTTLAFSTEVETEGWLMVTERWAPSWKAFVNGEQSDILGANFVFRAIKVAKGKNIVRFSYEPKWWGKLLFLSWGTIALITIISLFMLARRQSTGEVKEEL
ncbi:MAG: YfhO family protein, partial [Nitrospinota bacterium]|nr:YfhO family protein [Nitrospinota bacterium]